MKIRHRRIDIASDRDYVLEKHCETNYESDTPWQKEVSYACYREEWFSQKGQIDEFLEALAESMEEERTIADIILDDDEEVIGYLWVPFFPEDHIGLTFAEVNDLYVEPAFRNQGIATYLMQYAENHARKNHAKVLRSSSGSGNHKSIAMHKKLGYSPYRYSYEKLL